MGLTERPAGRSTTRSVQGPNLLNLVLATLLRARKGAVLVGADVKEMFLQVRLLDEDLPYHRFLWRDKPSDQVQEYQILVHPFGSRSSPAVALHTVRAAAEALRHRHPRAAEAIIHSTIVDDTLDSVNTEVEAISLLHGLRAIYASCGMDIAKFVSSSPEVLAVFLKEDHHVEVSISGLEPTTQGLPHVTTLGLPHVTTLGLPHVTTLGLIYQMQLDQFTFRAPPVSENTWTKRTVLSYVQRMFDPIGLVGPVLVMGRAVFQDCWKARLAWDEPLTGPLHGGEMGGIPGGGQRDLGQSRSTGPCSRRAPSYARRSCTASRTPARKCMEHASI